MRVAVIAVFLLAACGRADVPDSPPSATPQDGARGTWDLQSSDEGVALVAAAASGGTALRLFCPTAAGKLLVNVPSFEPIVSEERLSFGQGGEVVALVADPAGDAARGGVTGEGPVPANLVDLLSGGVTASYGAQTSGPHQTPPASMVTAFSQACRDGGSSAAGPDSPEREPAPVVPAPAAPTPSPCLVQDGKPVPANAIRAVGTEPFWGARVEGRCVTYSHPDDQAGTRVWTKFSGTTADGTWTGSLGGKPFVMRTRPQAGCSDGMSDRRYPIAVSLTVGGEQRSGCAEPR